MTSKNIQDGKKSREALSGGRYNLKHFVTANARQFAHNAFNGFNTDVAWCQCERT
jgi:hypothetical protein